MKRYNFGRYTPLQAPIDLSRLENLSKSLDYDLGSIGTRLAIATAAVVVGLLIEYKDDGKLAFFALLSCIREKRLDRWRSLERQVRTAVVGGLFITAGVGAELWYEHRTNVVEGRLQETNNELFANLRVKASAADERAKALDNANKQLDLNLTATRTYLAYKQREIGTDLENERQNSARFKIEATQKEQSLALDIKSASKSLADTKAEVNMATKSLRDTKHDVDSAAKALVETKAELVDMAICNAPRSLPFWELGTVVEGPKTPIEALKAFPRTVATIKVVRDGEARRAASYVANVLKNAKWDVRSVDLVDELPDGIEVKKYFAVLTGHSNLGPEALDGYVEGENRSRIAANALIDFLHLYNWQAVPGTVFDIDLSLPIGLVQISVGLYPPVAYVSSAGSAEFDKLLANREGPVQVIGPVDSRTMYPGSSPCKPLGARTP
jgi:hypothetical protein